MDRAPRAHYRALFIPKYLWHKAIYRCHRLLKFKNMSSTRNISNNSH
ncbi:hypothetical protein DP49_5317 [Burkholderia pseudomallei]|nr:hypothetical protein DP49_5317 [Burkholderia pseudomallei]